MDVQKSLFVSQAWWTMGEIQPRVKRIGVNGVSSPLGCYFTPIVLSLPPDYSHREACSGHTLGSVAKLAPLCPWWHSRQHPQWWEGIVPGPLMASFCTVPPTHKGSPASEGSLTWELLNITSCTWKGSPVFCNSPVPLQGLFGYNWAAFVPCRKQTGKKSLIWIKLSSMPLSVLKLPPLWLLPHRS